jgi:aminoglycoside 6-adenylyltransferase
VRDQLLEKIVAWAQHDENVLALILTGSSARVDEHLDEFSDLDIEVVARDPSVLASSDEWFRAFGEVWVVQAFDEGQEEPSRLVFYEKGAKVDFTLAGVERVQTIVETRTLDSLYERGYRVLLDKAGITVDLPEPSGAFPIKARPDQREFLAVVSEFWFEATHIPRYLLREDLWVVKFRDWTMKEQLLTMLEWHASAAGMTPRDVWHIGSHMRDWVDADTWRHLHEVFGRFDRLDGWRALLATISLFRRLAQETAQACGLIYPQEIDDKITAYIFSFERRIQVSSSGLPIEPPIPS